VVVHPDDDHGGVRSSLRQGSETAQARGAQNQLVDYDDGRPQPPEQPDQVREVGGRGKRLDPRLALEQLPERRSHTLVARGDEDRDLRRLVLEGELRNHPFKDRPPAPGRHRGRG